MSDPVILWGTQSNGETLPVQVNELGQLVAEGLQGPEGPIGPEGPPGPSGELPDGAVDGNVLSWENGEATWADPPSGLPEPMGIEGQIIQIVNSEPVWVTNNAVPNPSPNKITAVTGSTNCATGVGIFDDDGVCQPNGTEWDTFARYLNCWRNLDPTIQTGISSAASSRLTVSFDVEIQRDAVLEIGTAVQAQKGGNESVYMAFLTGTHNKGDVFETVNDGYTWPCSGSGVMCQGTGTMQWMALKNWTGTVNIEVRTSGSGVDATGYQSIQNWRIIDPARAALLNQAKVRGEVQQMQRELSRLREAVTTMDIDLLRRRRD